MKRSQQQVREMFRILHVISQDFFLTRVKLTPNGLEVEFSDGLYALVPASDLCPRPDDPLVGAELHSAHEVKLRFASGERDGVASEFIRRITDSVYRDATRQHGEIVWMGIGDALQTYRKHHGLSRATLAERASTTAERIAGVEEGDLASLREIVHLIAPMGELVNDVLKLQVLLTGKRIKQAIIFPPGP